MDTERPPARPPAPTIRRARGPGAWDAVERMPYKPGCSAPFRDISRQLLFSDSALACELRYFELGPYGHSTLERHRHVHAVMVARGSGRVLVGEQVEPVATGDLVFVPAWTWHQFRADREPLGFLCMVNADRDRPQQPTPEELAALRALPPLAAFLDG